MSEVGLELTSIELQKNEPKTHPSLRKSFLFVPTAGMRLAPEILLLELFREVYFDRFSEESREIQLNPYLKECSSSEDCFSLGEKAVIFALRGRRKEKGKRRKDDYYAPAYPCLVRHSWLRKKTDRVVKDFLLSGPISQYLEGTGRDRNQEKEEFMNLFLKSLDGNMTASGEDFEKKEILSVALRNVGFEINEEKNKNRLLELVGKIDGVFRTGLDDELAGRVFKDVLELCSLECKLPRLQWLTVFMSFLRFAIPSWLLSQMKLTVYLRDWLIDAIDKEQVTSNEDIKFSISTRNRELLHPTLTPTREIQQHVEDYMKARVELNLLLYCLDSILRKNTNEYKVIVTDNPAAAHIRISDLLVEAKNSKGSFIKQYFDNIPGMTARKFITRSCERYEAWKNPLKKGQGKNYDEFLRILRKAEEGDEGGAYLLVPVKKGRTITGFKVFPGPMLIKTMAFLAASSMEGKGKLMLGDIEEHFRQYGIEFGTTSGARSLLINKLLEMGLLKGSPDAGESAEVVNPYFIRG